MTRMLFFLFRRPHIVTFSLHVSYGLHKLFMSLLLSMCRYMDRMVVSDQSNCCDKSSNPMNVSCILCSVISSTSTPGKYCAVSLSL